VHIREQELGLYDRKCRNICKETYLGMDGSQVGVLKEANQVSLRGLLQCKDGVALEAEVSLEVLSNLPAPAEGLQLGQGSEHCGER
jgi:hypothetical protein